MVCIDEFDYGCVDRKLEIFVDTEEFSLHLGFVFRLVFHSVFKLCLSWKSVVKLLGGFPQKFFRHDSLHDDSISKYVLKGQESPVSQFPV